MAKARTSNERTSAPSGAAAGARRRVVGALAGLSAVAALGCTDAPLRPDEKILAIPETEQWTLPQLQRPVQVVRTEANVPHIYANNRRDLALVQGFVVARDRFFMMDLARRLGTGTISDLLGDAALEVDQESRGIGMTFVTDRILESLPLEMLEYFDAFAEGVNAYIAAVEADRLPPPSELNLAFGLLGASSPIALMKPYDRRSVAGMLAVVLYDSSYETGDVGRAATAAALPTLFTGATFENLRRKGAIVDLWQAIEPIKPFASAPGLGTFAGSDDPKTSAPQGYGVGGKPLPSSMAARFIARSRALQRRLNRDREAGFGSNAWAVSGSATPDGAALLAGDGHLSLSVPSILYQLGMDTSVFGRGDTHQLGLTIPGFPVMAIGTNGHVAWSQTQLMGDITDWYREALRLDAEGRPAETLFHGTWKDLLPFDETYDVADVPALDSLGRSEVWTRWETFDGRWIAEIEGRTASADEVLLPGESLVNLQGSYVVPGDEDGDGVITAISFDYAGFDAGAILSATDALGHAGDVYEFREAMRGLVGYSQNFTVADSHGNILYSAYQAVPCRAHLDRNPDGSWAPGADPNLLLDGSTYGSFRIPIHGGIVDESEQSDPSACVVPFEATPMAVNPSSGFVATANNDPAGLSFDGSLSNDAWYIGGPWDVGFRVDTIARRLGSVIADGSADIVSMADIQGDHSSPLAKLLLEQMLASIDYAEALSAPSDPADQRLAAIYAPESDAMAEVKTRLSAWAARGYIAASGVDTVYSPAPSQEEKDDAVATMLFNAWMGRVIGGVFDDEGLPGVWQPGGTHGRVRALDQFLRGRADDNPLGLASHNAATGESVFFDVLGTDELESSHEIVVKALVDALAFLRSVPAEDAEPGNGGFATDDMSEWLWGLRHQAKMESLLADFLGDDDTYAALTESFAIDTTRIPLSDGILAKGDPRRSLRWFPRPGDQYGVDAANSGTNGVSFSHGSGPVMRMVVSLKGDEVKGVNIIPGGQSALTDSDYFADQARRWLANETLPMRFSVDQVVDGATGRELYTPR